MVSYIRRPYRYVPIPARRTHRQVPSEDDPSMLLTSMLVT
jgi:hypothetical protein